MYRFLLILLVATLLVGCNNDTGKDEADGNIESEAKEESTLNVAYMAQPPSLDPHVTVAVATSEIGRVIFETLLSFNEKRRCTTPSRII